jgi:alanine racemase
MKTRSSKTHILSDRALAHLDSRALIHNYKTIARLTPKHRLLPMLKANAYGHDAVWAARTLLTQPRLAGYGVATLEEGAELRSALGAKGRKLPLLVFSGASLWNEEKGRFCVKYALTPVLSLREDWKVFLKKGWAKKLDYQLKFNTGMNRLGLTMEDASEIIGDWFWSRYMPAWLMRL